jgi:CRISPR/Cas system-associated exonuclease Cas4 (RecB family)
LSDHDHRVHSAIANLQFQFSQGNLEDYVDCPRRFQLRHVLMQPWPALITESPVEYEEQMRRGADLHRLAHQVALGIDTGQLAAAIDDEILAGWWRTFLDHPPAGLPQTIRRAEVVLAAPLADHRLVAKVDLLAAEPGERLVIVDWKTVRKPPSRSVLAARLQTRVYRYLPVVAGAAYNGGQEPRPEQVEMVYWFAERGGATERFPYDSQQHEATGEYLADLIARIAAEQAPIWPLTPDPRRCRTCQYRSLCERGVRAGLLEDLEEDAPPAELEIDLEQVAEVEF